MKLIKYISSLFKKQPRLLFPIEYITLEEIIERYPQLTEEQINSLKNLHV